METSEAQSAQIGVMYTAAARDRNGGNKQIRARLNQRIAITNRSSRRSKTNFSLRRVALRLISYKEGGLTLLGNLNDLTGGGNSDNEKIPRNEAVKLETQRKADLVMLITTETGGGGTSGAVGWAPQPGFYSAINANQLLNQAIPHELGHNYNAEHEKGHTVSTSSGSFVTLMWPSLASNWIQNYSNPNVRYKRTPTGTASLNNSTAIRARAATNANRF